VVRAKAKNYRYIESTTTLAILQICNGYHKFFSESKVPICWRLGRLCELHPAGSLASPKSIYRKGTRYLEKKSEIVGFIENIDIFQL
jgi:hypothetical protein